MRPHIITTRKRKGKKLPCVRESDISKIINQLSTIRLKNYAEKFKLKKVNDSSSFTEIPNSKRRIIVKKSSLCWLLREEVPKLSSDRKERVKSNHVPLNIRIGFKTETMRKRKQHEKVVKMRVNHFGSSLLKKY